MQITHLNKVEAVSHVHNTWRA